MGTCGQPGSQGVFLDISLKQGIDFITTAQFFHAGKVLLSTSKDCYS